MTNSTLNLALQNESSTSTVYAYVTGQALDNNNALVIMQADGKTPYYPSSPSSTGQALAVNCAIPLGAPGTTAVVTIPRIAGGRIWFCLNDTLTFLLNPGPGLVEPSVSNQSDPNYLKTWGFCEFTFNDSQLYANISYVDFVSIPISMTLTNTSGASQHVAGIPQNGLATISNALIAQNKSDGAGWDQLVVSNNGSVLRALSPNTGHVLNNNLFAGYYDSYVNAVYSQYTSTPLSVDTQAQWGVVQGTVSNNVLTFPNVGSFAKPAAADIFSCSTGPFAASATNTAEMGAITARLAAGFNRSTLLIDASQPSNDVSSFYSTSPTNFYSKICHAANLDQRGYAFPYDDVQANGGADQSGAVYDGSPQVLTVAVGGIGAHT
ncbi:Glucan endo-1,3-beta-glucosidase [Lachnellula suecica]|uniref:Glucan endo-1,3-beta-glucosidase n=1 Tax=Lachnellula suecica TaxID=602035 RepID=A0A8T9BZH6_9HELO|nr:Glucan endo-1,3-beta-glucosidase [Lachnellula suecica]